MIFFRGGADFINDNFFLTFNIILGWDGTLDAIFDDTDCKQPDTEIGETGDCGKFGAGIAFMMFYLVLRLVLKILGLFSYQVEMCTVVHQTVLRTVLQYYGSTVLCIKYFIVIMMFYLVLRFVL